ncbi:hypothetical protein A5N15_01020 [Rothia kristinae]|uniref:Uncharacterized protein n=1 Tax=Rothia kristinae TaxID=37923 RepID=A0A657IVV7_9MICC|nr:hypothetical protein A5N15_01020 [Rothia kristinae]
MAGGADAAQVLPALDLDLPLPDPLTSFSFDNPSSGSSCSWWQIFCGSGSSYGSDYSTSRPTADQTTEYFGQPGNRAYNRVLFRESKDQGYVTGFGYDRSVRPGSVSSGVGQNPSSYLWSETNGWAQPFTQMYLRPKVRSSDLAGLQTAENGSYTASDAASCPTAARRRPPGAPPATPTAPARR